ncbi:MAG: mechanosensitive ion channel [Desulfobulbaceae bacterium]|nr:mechanosensitive ion channel [Desulfobulbaceae bacterium]
MDFKGYFSQLAEFSVRPLFKIAETEVSLVSIFLFFFTILVSFAISSIFQRGLQRSLAGRFKDKQGTLAAILRLVHYTVLVIGFGVALQTIGINLSTLFAAGAIFAIAIGFAMQNVVQNFVSGIILLAERIIKPGDVIEVEGTVVKVIDMGIRTTVVRTWREEDLIMPNSVFSQSTVKNYTLRDNEFRLGVEVGVTYDSDMEKVMKVLEKTAREVPWRFKDVDPRVLLTDFGDSAVIFGVYLNINDPWKQRIYMSDLRKAIWFAFKKENIVIAFNQMDVHFDPPVSDAIASLRKAA